MRRVDVHDAAAQGKLPRALNKLHARISRRHQLLGKLCGLADRAFVQMYGVCRQTLLGNGVAKRRVGGGQNHIKIPLRKSPQHADAVIFVLVRGGDVIKGQVARRVKRGAKPILRQMRL